MLCLNNILSNKMSLKCTASCGSMAHSPYELTLGVFPLLMVSLLNHGQKTFERRFNHRQRSADA